MCGIAGVLAHTEAGRRMVRAEVLEKLAGALAHRGPDGAGFWTAPDRSCGLAHRRLKVIDLSPAADQPAASGDGRAVVVHNGEVWNFAELRQELIAGGRSFRSRGDAEVIAQLWAERGADAVARFEGMFAFAAYEPQSRRLTLVRDRLGVKPLCYVDGPDYLAFASEPGALLAAGLAPARLSPAALGGYLERLATGERRSAFAGVLKLPPAHTLSAAPGVRPRLEGPYWELRYEPKLKISFPAACAEAARLLRAAVRRRLVADVPLGVFLSGGADSALVAAAAAEECGGRLRTFTISFEDPEYDEGPWARQYARAVGAEHQELRARAPDEERLRLLARRFGEPFADSSAVVTLDLAEQARAQVTAALTGDGGDESFAGYERYAALPLSRAWRLLPAPLRAAAGALLRRGGPARRTGLRRALLWLSEAAGHRTAAAYRRATACFRPEELEALLADGARPPAEEPPPASGPQDLEPPPEALLDRLMRADVAAYLPDDLLVKADRATMAWGLEARSPFLDRELMEFAARLPAGLKAGRLRTKRVPRELVRRRFGRAAARRRKRGFGVPLAAWLAGPLAGTVRQAAEDSWFERAGIFRPGAARRLLEEHSAGRADHSARLWALLMAELWAREHRLER